MNIRLHIGAHKTATTHIQKVLSLIKTNTCSYNDNPLCISIPANFRKEYLQLFLNYAQTKDMKKKLQIEKIAPDNGVWLISEENFLGVPYDFIRTEKMYPYLQERLKSFKDIFSSAEIEVFFSLRSYDTFYRSIYLEIIRNNGYIPFHSYYKEEFFKQCSWKTIIDTITKVIPQNKITLWQYEDYGKVFPTVLEKMTGKTANMEFIANMATKKERRSLSNKAVQELALFCEKRTQQESKDMVEFFYNKYPVKTSKDEFRPFNADTVSYYQNKYHHDLHEIKTLYPDINFITRNNDDR